MISGKEIYCFYLADSSGIGTPDVKTSIMIRRKSDVPFLGAMGCPGVACIGWFVDDGDCSGWGHRYAIEIVHAMKVCVGGDFRIDVCWAHHIQCFSHFCISWHHRWSGNFGLTPTIPEMKRNFTVWIDRSVELRRCICGGGSFRSIYFCLMYFFTTSGHSLSIRTYCGWIPRVMSSWCKSLKVSRCLLPVLVFRHMNRIAFM